MHLSAVWFIGSLVEVGEFVALAAEPVEKVLHGDHGAGNFNAGGGKGSSGDGDTVADRGESSGDDPGAYVGLERLPPDPETGWHGEHPGDGVRSLVKEGGGVIDTLLGDGEVDDPPLIANVHVGKWGPLNGSDDVREQPVPSSSTIPPPASPPLAKRLWVAR